MTNRTNNDAGDDKKQQKQQPIIIKKVRGKNNHAAHGGAWKVAYADFVTAMMAFFLLLWLLNALPSSKLDGIAAYFAPTIGLVGQKGIGLQGGKAHQTEGIKSEDLQQGVQYGVPRTGEIVDIQKPGIKISKEEIDNKIFTSIEDKLHKMILNSDFSKFKSNILFKQTPKGLEIDIVDRNNTPMFKAGSAQLTAYAQNILLRIIKLIKFSPNLISITGHTDKSTTGLTSSYTNWDLSADRANAARKFMNDNGIPQEQIGEVVAKADTDPLDAKDPYAVENRRISIVLLRNSVIPYYKVPAPQELLNNP